MTRKCASMESILGRHFIRKRTARRYYQRLIARTLKARALKAKSQDKS